MNLKPKLLSVFRFFFRKQFCSVPPLVKTAPGTEVMRLQTRGPPSSPPKASDDRWPVAVSTGSEFSSVRPALRRKKRMDMQMRAPPKAEGPMCEIRRDFFRIDGNKNVFLAITHVQSAISHELDIST